MAGGDARPAAAFWPTCALLAPASFDLELSDPDAGSLEAVEQYCGDGDADGQGRSVVLAMTFPGSRSRTCLAH